MADTEILLESGTNEIEIMQFTINDELYGINVAKVREIMMTDKVIPTTLWRGSLNRGRSC